MLKRSATDGEGEKGLRSRLCLGAGGLAVAAGGAEGATAGRPKAELAPGDASGRETRSGLWQRCTSLVLRGWGRRTGADDEEAAAHERLVHFTGDRDEPDVPQNAPQGCPGVESATAGENEACEGCPNRYLCASGQAGSANASPGKLVAQKLIDVKHKILVLSGKGGVGKSTVACQLAWALHAKGHVVGLLDIDICGPSIPRMTGKQMGEVKFYAEGWLPVSVTESFLVMSVGFLLNNQEDAVIWRGPKKNGLIRQFLCDVYWGSLDYLIIDTPPGTSDEHLSVVQYLQEAGITGAVIVTTPQEISLIDVRKEITFCRKTNVTILGMVENMSDSILSSLDPEAVQKTCQDMSVPYAGSLSMDRDLMEACERGRPVPQDSNSAKQLEAIINRCIPKA